MNQEDDKMKEGHTREWQDRARVVLDAKKEAQTEASPNQSPVSGTEPEDVEEKSDSIRKDAGRNDAGKDGVY